MESKSLKHQNNIKCFIIIIQLISMSVNAQPGSRHKSNYYKAKIENNINKREVFNLISQFKIELKDTLLIDSSKASLNFSYKKHKEALWLNALCYLKQAELTEFPNKMCFYDNALKPIWSLLRYSNDTIYPSNKQVEIKRQEIAYLVRKECVSYFNSIGNMLKNIDPKICLCSSEIHDMIDEEKEKKSDDYHKKMVEHNKKIKLDRDNFVKDSLLKNTPFVFKEIVYKRNRKLIADSSKSIPYASIDSLNAKLNDLLMKTIADVFNTVEGKSYTEHLVDNLHNTSEKLNHKNYLQANNKVYNRILEFKKQKGQLVLSNFQVDEFYPFFSFLLSKLDVSILKPKIIEGASIYLPFSLTVNPNINTYTYEYAFVNGYLQIQLPFPALKTHSDKRTPLIILKPQKQVYQLYDTIKLNLYNPEKRVFQDCENGVFHTLEKLSDEGWKIHYGCCMCNLRNPPHYFNDSTKIFSTNTNYIGTYRVKMQSTQNRSETKDMVLLDDQQNKKFESSIFYSENFYVLPKKIKPTAFYENQKNMNASQKRLISYYENSKLKKNKATLYDNIYIISKCAVNIEWYDLFTEQYRIYPVFADTIIKSDDSNIKKVTNSPHFSDDSKCNQVSVLSKELSQEISKYIPIRGNLIKLDGVDALITNRVNVTLKKDMKSTNHEFLLWIQTKKYKISFAESNWNEVTQFQIEFETNKPDELLKLTSELVASGYFTKVSNIFEFPPIYTPKN